LVQNQLYGAHETQYLQTNVQNVSNRSSSSSSSAEKGKRKIKSP
jgi:hypothetical protein